MRYLLAALIRFYQAIFPPLWHTFAGPHAGCRFTPTCSEYAREAIIKHGAWKGSALAFKRICRCHPGSAGGYDPVP